MDKRNTHVCGMAITLGLLSICLTAFGETSVERQHENAEPNTTSTNTGQNQPTSGSLPQTNFALIGKQAIARSTIENFINKGPFNDQQKNQIFQSLGTPKKENGSPLNPGEIQKMEDLVKNAPVLTPQQKTDLLKQINDNLKEAPTAEVAQGVAKSFAENPPTKGVGQQGQPAGDAAKAAQAGQQAGGAGDPKADGKGAPQSEQEKALTKQLDELKAKVAKAEEDAKNNKNNALADNAALRDLADRARRNQDQNQNQGRNNSGDQQTPGGGQASGGSPQTPPSSGNENQNQANNKKDHGNKNKGSEPLNFGDSNKGSDNKNDNNQNAKNNGKNEEPIVDMSKFAAKKEPKKDDNKSADALANLKKEFETPEENAAPPEDAIDVGGGGGGIGKQLANLGPSSVPNSISQGGFGGGASDVGSTFGFGDGSGGGGGAFNAPVIAGGGGGGGGGGGALGEFPGGGGYGGEYGGGPPPAPKFSGTALYATSSSSSGDDGDGDTYMGDGNYEEPVAAKKKASSVAEEVYLATRTFVKEKRPGPFAFIERAYPYIEARPVRRAILRSSVRAGTGGLTAMRPQRLAPTSRLRRN